MTVPWELDMTLLQPHPPVADWLEALSHDSPFERGRKTSVGGRTVPPLSAVPSLFSFLKDSEPGIRLQAIMALGNLGEVVRRVLPMLRAALRETALEDVDESVRACAVHAILQVGPQPATEVCGLIDSLQEKIELVRFHAAIALGNLGCAARSAVPALIRTALRDEEPAVRLEAAMALWNIDHKGPLVVPALIKALADDNELICWIAADCLGQIGPEARDAVPALQQALRRPFKMGLIGKGVALALRRIDPEAAADG
jgi:HEAT repeat protein